MRAGRIWLGVLVAAAAVMASIPAAGQVALRRQAVIAPPGAVWKPVVAEAKISPVTVQAVQTTAQMAKLKLALPGYHQLAVMKSGMRFQRLAVADGGTTMEIGKPEVPMVRRLIALPEGATAKLSVKPGAATMVRNLALLPVQEPVPEQGRLEMPFKMDRAFYARDLLYPAEVAKISEPMMLGRTRVVLLEVAPMHYNPARKTLTVHPDVEVDVSFSRPAASVGPARRLARDKTRFDLSAGVINADQFGAVVIVPQPMRWDYLIICPDQYLEEIQPLVEWKQAKKLGVHVARTSYVGSSPSQIRDFIRGAFDDHDTRYVLLVGDTDTIPQYTYNGPAGSCASDYYYALVAGGDLMPDVAVGRLSGRSEAEISHMVDKTVGYEKSPFTPSLDWYKKALCISDSGYFQDTSNWVATFLGGHGYTVQKLYHSMGNATSTNVRNAVNDGRALVNYRGHGSTTGWSTSGFNNSGVNSLSNGRMMPVIISPTCLTGNYDASSDCYGETWVKSHAAEAPRGGVAYWGSSRVSYGGYNDELCKGAYKARFDDGMASMGDIVNRAKVYMITAYGFTDTAKLELHMFTLFGDPELNVRTEKPLLLRVAPRRRVLR